MQQSGTTGLPSSWINKGTLSQNSIDLIMSSWSTGTKKQYTTYINKWFCHCKENKINPSKPGITQVADFLSDLFKTSQIEYSAMNTARSALSAVIEPIDGITAGSHPLIKRIMKGIFKTKPSLPKYTVTYDASKVLQYFSTRPPNHLLSIQELTWKLATLMALLSAQRAQTLHMLDVNYMYKDNNIVIFYLHELTKTSRPSFHPEPLQFRPFPQDEQMCVVQALNTYLDRTKSIRGNCTKLFISVKAPHKSVQTCTISRWIKSSLAAAGIDITVFTAHSTRAASSSFAKSKGLTVSTIAKAAGWSNARTFAHHYNKEICSAPNLGHCIQGNSL